MAGTIPLTPTGFADLKAELKRLKEVDEPAIIREVATAREHGDLSENAEYHAARERHGFIRGRIELVESYLAQAEVIDPKQLPTDRVAFGATVRLANQDTGEEVVYRLVGPPEADLEKGAISIEAPLARALMGKEVGDEVKFKTPGGTRHFEVLAIEFV